MSSCTSSIVCFISLVSDRNDHLLVAKYERQEEQAEAGDVE